MPGMNIKAMFKFSYGMFVCTEAREPVTQLSSGMCLPSYLYLYYNGSRATAHMDGILDFAVCIWSWLLVLGTRPIGREIACKKIRKMESMG